jgi:hypothetical protein
VLTSQPDVVDLIEEVAEKLTGGDTTEAVVIALRSLLASTTRKGTLFGANPGSARFHESCDPFAPALDIVPDAETGAEINC